MARQPHSAATISWSSQVEYQPSSGVSRTSGLPALRGLLRFVADRCREPVAEPVQDKARANFCGYFQPRPAAHAVPASDPAREAKARLDALFGNAPEGVAEQPADEAERARHRLDDLFGES